MPTYAYECQTCGEIEVFQRMSDPTLSACPECGRSGLVKQISAGAGVIFNGAGFFETDYNRSCEYKKAQAKDTGTKTCSGGSCAAGTGTSCCATAESA